MKNTGGNLNDTNQSLNETIDMAVFKTISNTLTAKEISSRYLINYSTAIEWCKIDMFDYLDGYKRFIIEYFSRVNIVQLKEYMKKIKNPLLPDQFDLAKITSMPVSEIKDCSNSPIQWKSEMIGFLSSIDITLLQEQRKIIDMIYMTQEFSFFNKAEPAPIYQISKKKQIIKITKAQEKIGTKALPDSEQLKIVEALAYRKGMAIPPIVKFYVYRLSNWASKISTYPDIDRNAEKKKLGRRPSVRVSESQ